MQHGFKAVAPDLVREKPGKGPEYYAKLALERKLCSSDAKNPVASLSSTLRDELNHGTMPGIRAERIAGKLCLFPVDGTTSIGTTAGTVISLAVSQEQLRAIDNLVEVGRFATLSEAAAWFLGEGMKAKADYLKKAEDDRRRIDELRGQWRKWRENDAP